MYVFAGDTPIKGARWGLKWVTDLLHNNTMAQNFYNVLSIESLLATPRSCVIYFALAGRETKRTLIKLIW